MTKKCCSCCCFTSFSCFPCFSARNTTDSSPLIATETGGLERHDDDTRTVPSIPPASTSHVPSIPPASSSTSHVASSSGEVASHPNASADALSSSSPNSVSTSQVASSSAEGTSAPNAASSSSANVANDNTKAAFPAVATPTPASIHPHASSSFSTAVAQTPSTSTGGNSSSSVQTMSDVINNIRKDAAATNVDLDGLMKHISELLEQVNGGGKKSSLPNAVQNYLPNSKSWIKLKDILSEATNFAKDIISGDAKNVVRGLLRNIGTAHLATTGLLVVANILERFEEVSNNKEECLHLMKEMGFLAKVVKQFEEHSQLKGGMQSVMEDAIGLIVESCLMCCSQMASSKYFKLLSASVDKEKLGKFSKELDGMHKRINTQMGICIYNISERKKAPLSRLYPEHAVGLEDSVNEVIDMLEWGSKQNALTVILHGFGGTGKTTLADAVFSRVEVEDCQYSHVQLFEDINSPPDILKLQKLILKDLMGSGDIPDIRKHQNGQQELGKMLQEKRAFIYIDNVLGENQLRELLPKNMNQSKKVRLLLTARDENVGIACPMETGHVKMYHMRGISPQEATNLLKKDIEDDIDPSQLNEIVEVCGGIPLMLTLVGPFIGHARNKQQAFLRLMQEKGRLKNKPFDGIERYLFAYDDLPDECKDPFLDICLFFKGWDWDTVADIVGDYPLEMLESRALVTKDTNGVTSLHDVILNLGCQQEEELRFRFRFTSASEMNKCLDRMEEKDIEKIKGIWLSDNKDLFLISAPKLDSMYKSLRILNLGNLTKVVEGNCNKVFKELIFFQGAVPYLPFDVTELDLKYLSYQPRDLKLFEAKMPPNIRYMELNGRLQSRDFQISSKYLQQLKNLRILKLTGFAQWTKVAQQLGDLVNGLQELNLSYCKSIKNLPPSISKLQSLRVLKMDGCSSLMHLPEDFGSLNSLQELILQGCTNLRLLPASIEKLSSLRLLDISSCRKLRELPDGIGNLTSLVNLSLNNCAALQSIPESIGRLKSLAFSMDMSGCLRLRDLPDQFVELGNLRELNLRGCRNLDKLPEGFGRLKYLVKLNLSECTDLGNLCNDFHCLSSLRILNLSYCIWLSELPPDFHRLTSLQYLYIKGCIFLKSLPEGFHDLPSLQHLYLCDCPYIKEEWMDNLVKMKTLQIINIEGSRNLVRRWRKIQREGNHSWSFAVYTGQDLSKEEKENIQQKLLSELDCLLFDKLGEPFKISELPPNTLSLVMFHSNPDDDFPWPLIEETSEDIETEFQMIYIGKHFNKVPRNVKKRILGYSQEISDIGSTVVKLLLTLDEAVRKSWLLTLDENVRESWLERYNAEEPIHFLMKMVEGSKDDKCSPCWKVLSNRELEEFVLSKYERYLKLKGLPETPQESNLQLLTELFATREEENIFLRNSASASNKDPNDFETCGLSKLKGKTIILEMRRADLCNDIRLSSLIEMYVTEKEQLDLEIISIPIVQSSTQLDVLDAVEQCAKEVPWLVLQNPLEEAVKYFLIAQWEWGDVLHYPSIIWIIEPKGRISICKPSSLFMLNTWGPKAYPFTHQKFEELRKNERNALLKFLFNHLESDPDQVKEAMFQGKMICLFKELDEEVTRSISNVMTELRDSIHTIYIPRYYRYTDMKMLRVTDTIYKSYYLLENVELPQASEIEMEGMSVINLSEHGGDVELPQASDMEMEGMSVINLSEHEAMRFWMRLLYLKEEFYGMEDGGDKKLCERKRLKLHDLHGSCMTFMEEDGKMVAACRGETMKWIFRNNSEDRAKPLMKRLVKVSKEEGKQTDDDSASVLDLTKKMQTADQQNVDVDLEYNLSNYISELLEVEKLYQLFEFKKEGKKKSRPKAAGHNWPTLKNLLTEGESAFIDNSSLHGGEEDVRHLFEIFLKSLLKEIGKAQWAAAGLQVVAELLEKFETLTANQNEWLLILEAMYRLAIYLKQFNERPELLKLKMKNTAAMIMFASVMCCAEMDPSKFPRFLQFVSDQMVELRKFRERLEEMCDEMGNSITTGVVEDDGEYILGDVSSEDESGVSSEDESGVSSAKASPIADLSGEEKVTSDVVSAINATGDFQLIHSPTAASSSSFSFG